MPTVPGASRSDTAIDRGRRIAATLATSAIASR